MAERRLRPPDDVAREARRLAVDAAGVDRARLADIGSRMPVGQSTFLALLAAGVNGRVGAWATRMYANQVDTQADTDAAVLTAAGVSSVCEADCYGILADDPGLDVVVAVLRASAGGVERWAGGGWEPVAADDEPAGCTYVTLAGDALTDALTAVSEGHGLVLRAGSPKAFLPRRVPVTAAAGAVDGVYAAVDEADTTAVLGLFRADQGTVYARDGGEWVPDRDTLIHLVAAGVPLALIPPADVPVTLRQADDYDTVYPVVAAPDGYTDTTGQDGTPDFSTGVMVALPVNETTAQQLAVPGGLDPADMHVTLAYLGDQADCPVDMDGLAGIVADWAQTVAPLSGEVSGPATFEGTGNADNPVQVALADVPGLAEARQSLVDTLTANDVPVDDTHGYTAHISRAYGPDPVPTDGLGGTPLTFDTVGVWHGQDQQNIPLGGIAAAFNPSESRDPAGKWTAGGQSAQANALESARKSSAPKAAPAAKTVTAKPYHKPAGGGGAGKKAAAAKKAAAKKAAAGKALTARKAAAAAKVHAGQQAARDAETSRHTQYLTARAAEQTAESVRRQAFTQKLAGLPNTAQAAAQKQETARRTAWSNARSVASAEESQRHMAALIALKRAKITQDAALAKRLAAMHASAEPGPVTADAQPFTRTPAPFLKYWTVGPGGTAKIRWGTPSDWYRCVAQLSKYVHNPHVVKGQCATLHKIATGVWTGSRLNPGNQK